MVEEETIKASSDSCSNIRPDTLDGTNSNWLSAMLLALDKSCLDIDIRYTHLVQIDAPASKYIIHGNIYSDRGNRVEK